MANWDILTPVDLTISPSASAYSSGHTVGGLLTLNMPTTRGFITGVTVSIGEASIAVPGSFYFYSNSPTSFADRTAWLPVHADNILEIGSLLLPTAVVKNTRNTYKLKFGGGSTLELIEFFTNVVYAYYVTTGTPDFAAAQSIGVRVHVLGQK